MSAPAEPVPTLELPSDRLLQWSQMALLLAAQLAHRREQLDRLAWSDSEHAARVHDLVELRGVTVEPAVRAMTAAEIAHWPTASDDVMGTTALVTAEVAPINDRWALHATARHKDDTVSQTWVSCREEDLARGLASEILHRGEPGAVHRLGAHVQLAEQLVAAQHAQASAPPVDRDVLAAHLRGAWPADVAAAALRCPAWPTLADKLAAAHHEGHDLNRLLGRINTSGIPSARKPAALASWMLDQATAGGVTEGGGGEGRAPEQTSGSRHPHHDEIGSWADQLDPASMIDRAGALGVLGYCGTGVDTRLVTRFPDLLDDAARGVEHAAEGLAGDRERSAAVHLASVDDPTTPQREDRDGQALAGRDLHEAAAARATAAESHAAADAAVARANVTLTAPGPATTGQVTLPPRPQPVAPTRMPRRGR